MRTQFALYLTDENFSAACHWAPTRFHVRPEFEKTIDRNQGNAKTGQTLFCFCNMSEVKSVCIPYVRVNLYVMPSNQILVYCSAGCKSSDRKTVIRHVSRLKCALSVCVGVRYILSVSKLLPKILFELLFADLFACD